MTLRTDRMTQLRTQMGMKQNELADALDISRNQISKYERGTANPTLETLAKMADLFNTSTDYLLGRSNIPHPGAEPDANADLTPQETVWLASFRGRSVAKQKYLLEILDVVQRMEADDT